ncbi:MAG TPA: hypothetical protein VFR55_07390 [Dehalococcoidia bacterium]|nr:hypothetical protein [Dehalococcoidia bacterium]
MRYTIFKMTHGDSIRWYARPLAMGEMAPYPVIFLGRNAKLLACRKALALNQQAGSLALAA